MNSTRNFFLVLRLVNWGALYQKLVYKVFMLNSVKPLVHLQIFPWLLLLLLSVDILSKVQIAIEIEVMTVLFVMEVSIVETLILLMVIVCSFLIGRLSQQMIMFLTSSLSSDTWMPLFGQRETRWIWYSMRSNPRSRCEFGHPIFFRMLTLNSIEFINYRSMILYFLCILLVKERHHKGCTHQYIRLLTCI